MSRTGREAIVSAYQRFISRWRRGAFWSGVRRAAGPYVNTGGATLLPRLKNPARRGRRAFFNSLLEWDDILDVLTQFRLRRSEIEQPGGSKSLIARGIDEAFAKRGWREHRFDIKIVVDDTARDAPTHEVDMFKNRVAVEVEWNNKDPFFDRDLNNFRLLFDLRVIDVGVIITRSSELQSLFVEAGRDKGSFGASTTHLEKLRPRLNGGGGGGCPIVVFAINRNAFLDDRDAPSD